MHMSKCQYFHWKLKNNPQENLLKLLSTTRQGIFTTYRSQLWLSGRSNRERTVVGGNWASPSWFQFIGNDGAIKNSIIDYNDLSSCYWHCLILQLVQLLLFHYHLFLLHHKLNNQIDED